MRRHRVGLERCDKKQVCDVQKYQQQPGNERARKQIANGDGPGRQNTHFQLRLLVSGGHYIAEHHENDGRWNDLS